MEEVPCCHCGVFFRRSPRHKDQNYCMAPECRRAKKAAWRREKMHTDTEFRLSQQLSNHKWLKATPGYWKEYRRKNPDKAERNRCLQAIRNRSRGQEPKGGPAVDDGVIAKIDASKPNKFTPIGRYYLVPVIAKIDALKVRIYEITARYP